MKNSQSEDWILRVVLFGNQYLSQGSVELSVILFLFVLDCIISIWKLLQLFLFLSLLDW